MYVRVYKQIHKTIRVVYRKTAFHPTVLSIILESSVNTIDYNEQRTAVYAQNTQVCYLRHTEKRDLQFYSTCDSDKHKIYSSHFMGLILSFKFHT